MKTFSFALLACLTVAGTAEPQYKLHDRILMEAKHGPPPNMHKWSAAKHHLRKTWELEHGTDDYYNALSHAVHELHEFCGTNGGKNGSKSGGKGGKSGGKNGGKSGGKNGGKSTGGKKSGRRNLHKGCFDDTITKGSGDSSEDDQFRQQGSDDVFVPPTPSSFVPLTGDDSTLVPSPTSSQSDSNDLSGTSAPMSSLESFTTTPATSMPTQPSITVVPIPRTTETPSAPPMELVTIGPPTQMKTPEPSGVPLNPVGTNAPSPQSVAAPSPSPFSIIETDDIPTISNDDEAVDGQHDLTVLDDDEESPSNTSVDAPGDDDDDDAFDDPMDGAPPRDDEFESISNEGTNRNGNGGGIIPVDEEPPDTPFDLDEEITNEDFASPTNGD